MTSKIIIQDYTDKSFVVRGDTTIYKDVLKDLGGKWNSRLTDKDTGDKFGAWLFWTEKRNEVENWLRNGGEITKKNTNEPLFKNDTQSDITQLHKKIDNLTKLVEILLKNQNISHREEIVEENDDEETKTPPRRLLR